VADVSGVTVHDVLAIDAITKRLYKQPAGSGSVDGPVVSPQANAVSWQSTQTFEAGINAALSPAADASTYVTHTTAGGALGTRAAIPTADVAGLDTELAERLSKGSATVSAAQTVYGDVSWVGTQTFIGGISATLSPAAGASTYVTHVTAGGALGTLALIPTADVDGLNTELDNRLNKRAVHQRVPRRPSMLTCHGRVRRRSMRLHQVQLRSLWLPTPMEH
jgi:hypothetical protein